MATKFTPVKAKDLKRGDTIFLPYEYDYDWRESLPIVLLNRKDSPGYSALMGKNPGHDLKIGNVDGSMSMVRYDSDATVVKVETTR